MSGPTLSAEERDLARIVRAVRQLAEGRSNAVGTFTLTAGAASTVVTAPTWGASVLAFPKTTNAAAEIGNGTMYIGTVANGSFTVTHANNGQTDRTFMYAA